MTKSYKSIFKKGDESELINLFNVVYPDILERMKSEEDWFGFAVTDPQNGFRYQRLIYQLELILGQSKVFKLAINLFGSGNPSTQWHNHRFPFLIFPIAMETMEKVPVYTMEWEDKLTGAYGRDEIISGEYYAIERCKDVHHRVTSLCQHASLNIVNVTNSPSRDVRLHSKELKKYQIGEALTNVLKAVPQ